MKFILRIITLSLIIITISGCSINDCGNAKISLFDSIAKSHNYLSITLSDKDGNNFVTHFLVYDIASKKIAKVAYIPMTAQYPLGVVDISNNTLYCSERDSKGCDQLFKINLRNNKKEKLTDNLFAINYMIPVDNKIIMAAQIKGATNIALISYNLKSGALNLWTKNYNDTCVQSLTYNPYTKKIYASLYSWKERIEKSRKADLARSSIVIPPVNHIVEYDINGHAIKELFSTEEQIGTFVVSNKGNLAILRSASQVFQKKKLYLIHLKTGKREILNIPNYTLTGDVFFAPNDQGIFFSAFPRKNAQNKQPISNGLYYYDFSTKQIQTILSIPNSFINNFSLYTR